MEKLNKPGRAGEALMEQLYYCRCKKKKKKKKSCKEACETKSPGVGLQTWGDIFSLSFCLAAPGSATDPRGQPAATHSLPFLPRKKNKTKNSRLYNATSFSPLFFFKRGLFVLWPKSQREKARELQNNDAFTPTAFALNPSQKWRLTLSWFLSQRGIYF